MTSPEDDPDVAPPSRAQLRARASDRRAARAKRRGTMLDLVVSGYPRELIAQRLGVSVATVRREVDRAIDERRLDPADRYVQLQVARLTKAMRAVDDALERGDLKAVDPLLKLVGALDRYHGLTARAALPGPAAEPLRLAVAAPALALTHAAPAPQPIETTMTVAEEGA